MNKFAVLIADLIAIAVFALLARMAHQTDEMPLNFMGWLSTLWPFALGVLVAWIITVSAKRAGEKLWPAGVYTWVITVVIGLVIWGFRNASIPHWSFIIVATVMSGILLLGWRLVARVVLRRRDRQDRRSVGTVAA